LPDDGSERWVKRFEFLKDMDVGKAFALAMGDWESFQFPTWAIEWEVESEDEVNLSEQIQS
jgi:hypothetical protein